MKEKRGVLYIALVALLVAATTSIMFFRERTKTGFILISDVYNEFELKKDMEAKYSVTRNARKKILDSLQIDLSVLANRIKNAGKNSSADQDLFEHRRIEYDRKIQQFDQENAQLSGQLDEQVIKQLNQYVSDFGMENHYDIIFGNTTNGSIMYGVDKLNVTREVISYVNSKYKGVK